METKFTSLADLARLPYFELRDGTVAVRAASRVPVIDVHTHLAMSFVLPPQIDLRAPTPLVEHYLPRDTPLDLDVYINRNFRPHDLARTKRDLTLASLTSGGLRRTHTIPNLVREMESLGVMHSVILPIDFPFFSRNAETTLASVHGETRLIGFGSVHPYAPNVERRLDAQVALGARGIKVHPAVQLVGPENERALRLYRLCAERRLPVLIHCGPVGIELRIGRALTQVRRYEMAITKSPGTTFILGHSGALQMEMALALCQRFSNAFLELSSQSLSNVRRIICEAPPDRILFGTDWPWYQQAIGLAKVLLATEDRKEVRRAILFENAARLLGLAR